MSSAGDRTTPEDIGRGRVEALGDGVFAIVATLMVLEVKVPHVEAHDSLGELASALWSLMPKFVSWVISFLTVCVIWLNHHRLFKLTSRIDNGPFWWNAKKVTWISWLVAPFLLAPSLGCSQGAERLPPIDAGVNDADADDDADGDADADDAEVIEVTPELPAPVFGGPVRADVDRGTAPRLSRVGETPWLCWLEAGDPGLTPVRCAQVAPGPVVGSAWDLPSTGHGGVVGADGTDIVVAVDSGTRSLILYRSAGGSGSLAWDGTLASADGDVCSPLPAHDVVPAPDGSAAVVIAFRHDTRLFGCVEETWLSWRADGGWTEPLRVAEGRPSGLFATEDEVVALTTSGVFRAPALDGPWTQVLGGDTTAQTLQSYGAVMVEPDLLAVQYYNWASQNHVAVLRSPDMGASWTSRMIMARPQAPVTGAHIAAEGARIVVGWTGYYAGSDGIPSGGGAWLMASPDRGATWTEPAELPVDPSDAVAVFDLIIADGETIAAYSLVGTDDAWDFRGVYVRRLEL